MYYTTYCQKSKVWKGPEYPLLYHKNASVGRVLFDSLERAGKKILQVCMWL